MSTQPMSRQQRRQLAREAAKQAERDGGHVAAVPQGDNGEEPGEEQKLVTMPYAIAPKRPPAFVDTSFDVEDVYGTDGRQRKLLIISTGQGVQWYFLNLDVAKQLAQWLEGEEPGPASKLIIPGVSVRPDMFRGSG